MAEKVQGDPLGRQDARAGPSSRITARRAATGLPSGRSSARGDRRIEQPKGSSAASSPATTPGWRARHTRRRACRRDDRIGRDVAGAPEVFEQGGSHQRLDHEGRKRRKRNSVDHRATSCQPIRFRTMPAMDEQSSASQASSPNVPQAVRLGWSLRQCPPRLSSRARARRRDEQVRQGSVASHGRAELVRIGSGPRRPPAAPCRRGARRGPIHQRTKRGRTASRPERSRRRRACGPVISEGCGSRRRRRLQSSARRRALPSANCWRAGWRHAAPCGDFAAGPQAGHGAAPSMSTSIPPMW